MRKILLTTVTAEDPYIMSRGEEKLGPVLSMFYKSKWDVLALWATEPLKDKGEALARQIRRVFADCDVICKVISLEDKQSLLDQLKLFWGRYCKKGPTALFLGLNPGMPEINSLWVEALGRKVVDGKIFLPNEYYFESEFLWEELEEEALWQEKSPVILECKDSIPTILNEEVMSKIGMIGEDPSFKEVIRAAVALAEHDVPVLLNGETGTGKDLLAKLIHRVSKRQDRPYVCLNCAAIPEHLSESILFGHKKGSFTGAVENEIGKFRTANKGTLFLDEIGELSPKIQASLLRALESGFVEPVGQAEPVAVDVRIIAATHKNLLEEVRANRFREDLYYRLHIGVVTLPALRERQSDIPRLVNSFLSKINKSLRQPKFISEASLQAMLSYKWPGNIRELQNTLQRAILISQDAVLQVEDIFPLKDEEEDVGCTLPHFKEGFSLEAYLATLRSRLMHKALQEAQGKQNRAAQLLGISPQAVSYFLKTNPQDWEDN